MNVIEHDRAILTMQQLVKCACDLSKAGRAYAASKNRGTSCTNSQTVG